MLVPATSRRQGTSVGAVRQALRMMNGLRCVPMLWAMFLALGLLGPALGSGYVLTYDMVWVPNLAMRSDFLGVGSALPRAVPSDAVVAVLDDLVPGMVLQKIVLIGSLVGAGTGAAAMVRGPLIARLAATTFVIWNPFVIERLVLGHWPILVAYAALPWLVIRAKTARTMGPGLSMMLLVPLGSLSAGAGLMTALVVLSFGLGGRIRHDMKLLALVVASNAPWLISGLLHMADATSDPVAAPLFALRGEGYLPAPLTALGLGGIWNAEVVPATRDGVLAVVMTVVLVAVAAAGLRGWWRSDLVRDRVAVLALWFIGWALAVFTWASPSATGWLAAHVPGGGLLRDGSRLLALCVPLLLLLLAHGVVAIRSLVREEAAATMVAFGLVVFPLALMPDAAWGSSGEMRAVQYPAGFDVARAAIAESQSSGGSGDVVVLPFSAYRAPHWNHQHKVLDPLPRFLDANYVTNDELLVDGEVISGEDPRVPLVTRALAAMTAQERADALATLGIRFVVTDSSGPEESPRVAGKTLLRETPVTVIELQEVDQRRTPLSWWLLMGLAWASFLAPGVLSLAAAVTRVGRRGLR